MSKNKRPLWYAQYLRTEEVTDDQGAITSYEPVYGEPTKLMANWSPARGQTDSEVFGTMESYDRVIIADDSMPVLTEHSLVWIGKDPSEGAHNYIVKKVADSINGRMYAVKQVNVDA